MKLVVHFEQKYVKLEILRKRRVGRDWGRCSIGPFILFVMIMLMIMLLKSSVCDYLIIKLHYGLRGGVRNFFNVWCEQTLISHLSGCPKPRSKECPLLGPLLGPPGPKIDQKRVQIAQKRPKSDFEGSGGPKRLERCGTKLERVTGHIC